MPKDLSNLKPADGSVRTNRRRGRGPGSGYGGHTTGRGHKGAQSRSGYKKRSWFEGGQMPIHRRLPKRGFTNIFREEYQVVNVRDLERLGDLKEVTPEILARGGLVKYADRPIKLLADGEIGRALTITVTAASAAAREKIEAAGGSVQLPPPAPRRGKYIKKSLRTVSE